MTQVIDPVAALEQFRNTDPTMAGLLERALEHEPGMRIPVPEPEAAYFPTLVRSIVSQQISTKAAASIFARMQDHITLRPRDVSALTIDALREYGLSQQKAKYVQSLATQWPALDAATFPATPDEQVIRTLTQCYGIGVWTAEMFLLFSLARPDVFALGDFGLCQRVAAHYRLERTDRQAIKLQSMQWAPHRSVAALVLWHELDAGLAPG